MNYNEIIDTGLKLLDDKVSAKNKHRTIGVYEDVCGSRGSDQAFNDTVGFYVDNEGISDDHKIGVSISDDDDLGKEGDKQRKDDDDDEDEDEDDDDDEDEENSTSEDEDSGNHSVPLDIGVNELLRAISCSKKAAKSNKEPLSLEDMPVYVDMNLKKGSSFHEDSRKFSDIDKVLEKSIIKPGFEKLHALPCETSEKKIRLERKKEREKTKGAKWFNMSAPEVTDEVKHDLMALQMRSALDPKHFYKKNDLKVLPKYFQVGTVVDAPEDFYSSRIPKKLRRKTIVDELLADSQFKKYNKKRYLEIIQDRKKTYYKAHRHAQRLKRKGKKR